MDYKNQVQRSKTSIALLRKQLAKKQPLPDTIHCNTELMMQSKEPEARRQWGDGKNFHFLLFFLPCISTKKKKTKQNKIKIPVLCPQESLCTGEGRRGHLKIFTHQTLLNLFLLTITLFVSRPFKLSPTARTIGKEQGSTGK